MESVFRFRNLSVRLKWILVVLLVAVTHLLFQSFLLPYGKALRSLLPENDVVKDVEYMVQTVHSSTKSVMVRNPLTVNASDLSDATTIVGVEKDITDNLNDVGDLGSDTDVVGNDRFEEFSFTVEEENGLDSTSQDLLDRFMDNSFPSKDSGVKTESLALVSIKNEENDFVLNKTSKDRQGFPLDPIVEPNIVMSMENVLMENVDLRLKKSDGGLDSPFQPSPLASSAEVLVNATFSTTSTSGERSSLASVSEQSGKNHSATATTVVKKMRCNMPPKSITTFQEMNQILVKHRAKSRSMVMN